VTPQAFAIGIGVLIVSAVLTGLVRRFAIAHGLLDLPNTRSSHTTATPRGGGLAIVLATTGGLLALGAIGAVSARLLTVLIGGGAVVAFVGFLDDRRRLHHRTKLAVHLVVAVWAVMWAGGLPRLPLLHHVVQLGWGGDALAVIGIVWVLNLFNFMDGLDGIAASEGVFVLMAAACLMPLCAVPTGLCFAALILGAACLGFLPWNWAPARIFMGDVGSGFVGYAIAVLALAAAQQSPVALSLWLILGGVFFVDATVTLVRRALRGERIYEAHRSHAYQWLARRWGSHGRVTLAVLALNLVWLLPWAAWAARVPGYAMLFVIIALAPLAVLAVTVGSGRAEAGASA
jgi:Fuc2NAc and GlcNAc transferase